jgi:type I site-specific restriction endonuclease
VAFNAALPVRDQVGIYDKRDLSKLAFWMATGSGKTLLMHVNVLQYRHYLEAHGRSDDLNRIILLTPNEGLSTQHLEEFGQSGIEAERFSKPGGRFFASSAIQVLEVTKLAEESGEATVAVDAFEGSNLVLVDEGHRGAGGESWKDKRDRLADRGFSFEYSATFGQAMKAAGKEQLTQEYARCILFDYSYRYFYGDGYGKDYQIFYLAEGATEETEHLSLVASLLAILCPL